MFGRSQDKCSDLNLTYPPFKLNGFGTTGPRFVNQKQLIYFSVPIIYFRDINTRIRLDQNLQ